MADYKFDPFKFLVNRELGVTPTNEDYVYFNNFITCAALSMHPKFSKTALHTNTIAFGRLPKKIQCEAYMALNGNPFPYVPYLKKSTKKIPKEDIEMVAKIFEMSNNKAKDMIESGRLDMDKISSLYREVYAPQTIISEKTGKIVKPK